jgi:transposase
MWFAGIDWADRHHDVVVVDAIGRQVAAQRFEHSAAGVTHLIAFLGEVAETPEQIACIIEVKQGLLITALLEAGLAIYPVNPTTIEHLRRPAGAKTDQIDAYLLARTGRSQWPDLRRLQPDQPLIGELKTLTRDQDMLISEQTRLLNRLRACLKAYYPLALQCFPQLSRHAALAFLQAYPTPEQARNATVEDLREVLQRGRSSKVVQKAEQLLAQIHTPQLQADPVMVRTKARLMLTLVGQLELLTHQIADYDRAIREVVMQHADHAIFMSLPGAAQRLAPRLLAEWGDDRERYADAASVQVLAGTAPVVHQSGNYQRVHMRTACSKPLRQALYLFAGESLLQEAWARAYYDRKRQAGKTYAMAVRALANRWVRIIHAMWTAHQPYQRTIFEQAQRQHQQPVT